jgi:hypothetical protein
MADRYLVHDCRMIWASPTSPCWNPVANMDQTEAIVPSDQEYEDQIVGNIANNSQEYG